MGDRIEVKNGSGCHEKEEICGDWIAVCVLFSGWQDSREIAGGICAGSANDSGEGKTGSHH